MPELSGLLSLLAKPSVSSQYFWDAVSLMSALPLHVKKIPKVQEFPGELSLFTGSSLPAVKGKLKCGTTLGLGGMLGQDPQSTFSSKALGRFDAAGSNDILKTEYPVKNDGTRASR